MDIVEHGHGTFEFDRNQWRPPDDDRDAKSNASKINMLMVEKRINFTIFVKDLLFS